MATEQVNHAKAFAAYKGKVSKHGLAWPSDSTFKAAAEFVRAGTDRHLAAALMLAGKPTMEGIAAVTGSPHYNVVTALKKAGCKAVSGTDKEGYKVYAFTLPAKKRSKA